MFFPALIALMLHTRRMFFICLFLLLIYVLDLICIFTLRTFRVELPLVRAEGIGTHVEFNLPKHVVMRPGQYIKLCIPYVSATEWHPFSIIPGRVNTTGEDDTVCDFGCKRGEENVGSVYIMACKEMGLGNVICHVSPRRSRWRLVSEASC